MRPESSVQSYLVVVTAFAALAGLGLLLLRQIISLLGRLFICEGLDTHMAVGEEVASYIFRTHIASATTPL
ncbi:hypothetical protein EJ03DRAFT_35763 [Teratosphaeria nubilosa]|uniref:Uncharacterized protein n=1 Tax=Teratosphaeria nubilosa TaxID=161662 RepID=A0A6G1KU73_9PEZI|nr:hypothetical protein EJ03DRAFT_35763 [Teratosphaeria nubilosa]